MEQAEKLASLLQKLKANKEKVPLEVLKTKYKAAYEQLCQEIKDEAQIYIKTTAIKTPDFMEGVKVSSKHMDEIADIFNGIYKSGGYAKKIGRALFKNYSIKEVDAIAAEISKKLDEALLKYFHSKTCLYTTAECYAEENPQTPKIYNELINMFWVEETKSWREPEKGELKAALLIFVSDKCKEGKEHGEN